MSIKPRLNQYELNTYALMKGETGKHFIAIRNFIANNIGNVINMEIMAVFIFRKLKLKFNISIDPI